MCAHGAADGAIRLRARRASCRRRCRVGRASWSETAWAGLRRRSLPRTARAAEGPPGRFRAILPSRYPRAARDHARVARGGGLTPRSTRGWTGGRAAGPAGSGRDARRQPGASCCGAHVAPSPSRAGRPRHGARPRRCTRPPSSDLRASAFVTLTEARRAPRLHGHPGPRPAGARHRGGGRRVRRSGRPAVPAGDVRRARAPRGRRVRDGPAGPRSPTRSRSGSASTASSCSGAAVAACSCPRLRSRAGSTGSGCWTSPAARPGCRRAPGRIRRRRRSRSGRTASAGRRSSAEGGLDGGSRALAEPEQARHHAVAGPSTMWSNASAFAGAVEVRQPGRRAELPRAARRSRPPGRRCRSCRSRGTRTVPGPGRRPRGTRRRSTRRPRPASRRTRRSRAAGGRATSRARQRTHRSRAAAARRGTSDRRTAGRPHREQRVRHSEPWSSTRRRLPASTVEAVDVLGRQQEAIAHAPLGLGEGEVGRVGPRRGDAGPSLGVEAPHARRVARNARGVATSSTGSSSHRPPAPRNVASPDSALMPAPVRTSRRVGAVDGRIGRRGGRHRRTF